MTAETDLLPLYAELQGHPKIEIIKHYARANVAHATAAKDVEIDALRTRLEDTVRDSTNEIEALRAEVERLRSPVILSDWQQLEARAERLAEALDTIARVGKASRNQTTRTRWIVARAISALNSDNDWQALPKPKGFHDALLREQEEG